MGKKNDVPHIQYPSEGPIHYKDLIWTQGMRRGTKDYLHMDVYIERKQKRARKTRD